MSSKPFSAGNKRYFVKLLLFVIFFLEQYHAQCSSVSVYDRIVSVYHSTMALKSNDGNFVVCGEGIVNNNTYFSYTCEYGTSYIDNINITY